MCGIGQEFGRVEISAIKAAAAKHLNLPTPIAYAVKMFLLLFCLAATLRVTAAQGKWFIVCILVYFPTEGRIDAFERCLADTALPSFNTTDPTCTLSTSQLLGMVDYYREESRDCDALVRFADHIQLNNIDLDELSFLSLGSNNKSSSLKEAVVGCYYTVSDSFCSDYDLCSDSGFQATQYLRDACIMKFAALVSHGTNGTFSEKLYTYMMANFIESYEAFYYTPAITQHYLHTCTSRSDGGTEDCLLNLFDHCFELEEVYYYHPYWCYLEVLTILCSQFNGDERLVCEIVLEARMELSLVNECTNESNKGKCVSLMFANSLHVKMQSGKHDTCYLCSCRRTYYSVSLTKSQ